MRGALIFVSLLCLASCDGSKYKFECTVDRVEGTFITTRFRIKFSGNRMISLYRFTDGKKRAFMFPAERVSCKEI